MICDDFRARWSERNPVDGVEMSDDVDAEFARHRVTCAACAAYVTRGESLDALLGAALVVAPPPELAGRLQALAGMAPIGRRAIEPDAGHVFGIALEFVALLLVGIGAFSLMANNILVDGELAIGRLGDLLQGLSLVVSSPIVPYVQNLAFTGVEALATLLLLVMGFDRASNGLFGASIGRGSSK